MSEEDKINVHVYIYIPEPFIGYAGQMSITKTSDIENLVIGTLMIKLKVKGNSVFNFAETLEVYNRGKEQFLDKNKTFVSNNVDDGDFLMVTCVRDKKKLNDVVQIQKASDIDLLAMEISKGN